MTDRPKIPTTKDQRFRVREGWKALSLLCSDLVAEGATERLAPSALLHEGFTLANKCKDSDSPMLARAMLCGAVEKGMRKHRTADVADVASFPAWYLFGYALGALLTQTAWDVDGRCACKGCEEFGARARVLQTRLTMAREVFDEHESAQLDLAKQRAFSGETGGDA